MVQVGGNLASRFWVIHRHFVPMMLASLTLVNLLNEAAFCYILVILVLRVDWRRTLPIQTKYVSASWTLQLIRVENQNILGGTVSRLPLNLLPNGTLQVRHEPHLGK